MSWSTECDGENDLGGNQICKRESDDAGLPWPG